MRFSVFLHMERLNAEQSHDELYREFIDLCEFADQNGFSAIWTGEHHGMDFTITPNPFITLADLARRTKNVRLGTGTIVVPFWHPIRLAGEAALLDVVSQGRLDLGLARGAYSFEYERMMPGLDAWSAGLRLREMVPVLKGLWEGDFALDSQFWSFPKTSASPKPVQQPHPPIWVAARDPNSHEFAVANGCNVQVTPLWQGDDEVESLMQRFNDACVANPDQSRPQIMLLNHTYVGESDEDCAQGASEISRFFCYFGAWFKNERPISQGLIQPLTEDELAAMEMYSPDKMRAQKVIGQADEVIARIKDYEAMGYDEYSLWIDTGMSHARKRASLERFVTDVMPAFK